MHPRALAAPPRGLWPALAWVALAALATLGGCTTLSPVAGTAVDWAARDAHVAALADWQARGRIAIKSEGAGGQGDLSWRQAGADARIRVSGPFGAGAWEIRWDPQGVVVTSRNGQSRQEWRGPEAAEAFLGEQLGWPFPASSTRWWLLGLADPALPASREFSPRGELVRLEQGGWTVSYQRYEDAAGIEMPARLTLEGAHARLRMVIDRWCLDADCLGDAPAAAD